MTLNAQTGDTTNADSLCSLDAADAYHGSMGNDAWAALQPLRKEQLLRQGYERLRADYARRWPAGVLFGVSSATGVVPLDVRAANAKLAFYALTGALDAETAAQVKKRKVGPIETEFVESAGDGRRAFPDVDRLMAPYLQQIAPSLMIPLVRA